jgi:signal transduction histidine kinase
MKHRFVILFWLLLLVPTFLISAYLFQLLRREQVRMAQAVYSTAAERARSIAETIQLTTKGVEQTVTQALLMLPPDDLRVQLFGFVRATDLVSEAFIWSPERGLLFPRPEDGLSAGETRFVERYRDLFSGRVSWQEVSLDVGGTPPLENSTPYQESLTQKMRKKERQGWIPWMHEDRLSLLGWVQPGGPEALVYGVEMNLEWLLAWLVNYFPDHASQAVRFALVDGRGEVLHQTGWAGSEPGAVPDIVLPLAPSLPDWKLVISIMDPALAGKSGQGFMIVAGLLIAIFVVAIILGGGMLSWQANRNMMFAQQKTTFVSNVSHELKTPLTSIRMYAELLKEERVKDPEKKNHYLQVIVSESQRLTRLVNNVLDFGRLEQGKKQYHFRDLDLAEFLRGVVETQRLSVQKAGMVLENEIPLQSFRVRTDPDALEQVLLNLLDNAIKYAAAGKELIVDLKSLDDHFRLMVFDRGPGIAVRHRERIFQKFHRVDNSLTSRQPGSGLGLSIARSIMRELEGDICYEPRAGGGSCFVVLIPYRPAREAETSPRATEPV